MPLDPGHKDDGAVFNRFGLFNVMKSSDNRVVVFMDDLTINGQTEDFSRDPGWESMATGGSTKTASSGRGLISATARRASPGERRVNWAAWSSAGTRSSRT